jgi:hypothetical protein
MGEKWDGARALDSTSGEMIYQVRGDQFVDPHTGTARYRLLPDGQLVDAASGDPLFQVHDDGRVVAANCGALVMRLRCPA